MPLFTADLHEHNHRAWSFFTLMNGINNRLLDGLNVLHEIVDKAAETEDKTLFILGDLFEKRGIIPVIVYNAVYDLFMYANRKGVRIVFLLGNHEYVYRNRDIHSAKILSHAADIIEVPTQMRIGDINYCMIPSMDDHKELVRMVDKYANMRIKRKCLLIHQTIEGSKIGVYDRPLKHQISIKDLQPHKFLYVLAGNIHKPQRFGDNIFVLGSPYQIKSDERGQRKYFYEMSDDGLIFHEIKNAPKFHRIENPKKDKKEKYRIHDYLTILVDSQEEEDVLRDKYKNIRKRFEKRTKKVKMKKRSNITLGKSIVKMIDEYVDVMVKNKETKLDPKLLKSEGKSIYKEVVDEKS